MLTIISKYDIICNCITVLQHMRWPISGANRKDLRLVLDISAVLHGSFPPSDGHLQVWSMGDNIVDPFGALMADQMSPKLLVDCHSFPTLDENCSYSNPPKNRCFGEHDLEVLSSMRQLGCSNKLFKARSNTSLAMHDCLDLSFVWYFRCRLYRNAATFASSGRSAIAR